MARPQARPWAFIAVASVSCDVSRTPFPTQGSQVGRPRHVLRQARTLSDHRDGRFRSPGGRCRSQACPTGPARPRARPPSPAPHPSSPAPHRDEARVPGRRRRRPTAGTAARGRPFRHPLCQRSRDRHRTPEAAEHPIASAALARVIRRRRSATRRPFATSSIQWEVRRPARRGRAPRAPAWRPAPARRPGGTHSALAATVQHQRPNLHGASPLRSGP